MMLRFDDEIKAKDTVKRLRKEKFQKFCPLINNVCNNDCVCFKDVLLQPIARSNSPAPPIYTVFPKRCTNLMFCEEE